MRKKIYITALILTLIDLITKYTVTNYLPYKKIIPNFFNIDLTLNTGAAFSMLNNEQIILIIISILVLIYINKEIINKINTKLEQVSISMLIGGTLGNLVERIINNYVTDFLSFKIFNYNFPVFNIADILITIGAFLLIINIVGDKSETNSTKK